jgi:hypothetical protein
MRVFWGHEHFKTVRSYSFFEILFYEITVFLKKFPKDGELKLGSLDILFTRCNFQHQLGNPWHDPYGIRPYETRNQPWASTLRWWFPSHGWDQLRLRREWSPCPQKFLKGEKSCQV